MLTSLTIQNIALVERLTVRLQPGLTVITGETGAGKSIVIDALSLALGERANMSLIRDGEAKGIVEAEFDAESLNGLRLLVEEAGADWQPVLILRREITGKGTARTSLPAPPRYTPRYSGCLCGHRRRTEPVPAPLRVIPSIAPRFAEGARNSRFHRTAENGDREGVTRYRRRGSERW